MKDIRPSSLKRITTIKLAKQFINEQVKTLKQEIGDNKVILALSGGVDSSVVASILFLAIGQNLTCIHVNHGLLRQNESEQVINVFKNNMGVNLIYVDAEKRFLKRLENINDPEEKRKIIGEEFINVFAEQASKLKNIKYLAQGTIYPDILESDGVKSHHNVGGLPKELSFKLIEPIKYLYKDEVRLVGKCLGLPESMINRQPFPGPGLGVRCLGAITKDRLEALRLSDAILREEIKKAKLDHKIWQYFTIIPEGKSTGIKNNKRTYEWTVVIRTVNSTDATTASVFELSYKLLKKIVERILNEVPHINRVVYDLSPKPVSTIEWE